MKPEQVFERLSGIALFVSGFGYLKIALDMVAFGIEATLADAGHWASPPLGAALS
jgi:hypothetical protein